MNVYRDTYGWDKSLPPLTPTKPRSMRAVVISYASLLYSFPRPPDLWAPRCKQCKQCRHHITMPSDPRRHDLRRNQKKAVESLNPGQDSGWEDQPYSQPCASHHSKRPQKPPAGNLIIKGDVHINNVNDFTVYQVRREEARPQRPSTPIRNPHRRLQPNRTTTRSTIKYEPSSASEGEAATESDDSEPEDVAPRRPRNLIGLPERSRLFPEKKTRQHADEGYHTSGTGSAYTAQTAAKGKERGKGISTPSVCSSSSRTRLLSGSGESREQDSETDATSCHSEEEHRDDMSRKKDNSREHDEQREDEEAWDDECWKLPIHIGNPHNQDAPGIGEEAILDTGTTEDWIAQSLCEGKIKDMGVRLMKLSPEEQETYYRDFNGHKFQPKGKVNLTIQTEEFKGSLKCRTMQFFVCSKAPFTIVIGRKTIWKHDILTRRKVDTDGDGALVGIHGELSKEQRAEMKKKKEEQRKVSEERKKMRDSKTDKVVRQKEKACAPSSSKHAVHLATTVPKNRKPRSPPVDPTRQMSSSMEGTW